MALKDNLVSYWKLEESNGTRVDAHGSNDLTDNNTVLFGTGINNACADFERSNGEYLSITDASQSGLDFSTAFSANLWVNYESVPSSGGQWNFISKFLSTGNQRSYLLYANESGGSILLHFYETNNGSTAIDKSVTITPSTSTWYMYTVVYDGSGGTVDFYIDGSQVGTQQTGFHSTIYNGTAPFELGDVGQFGSLGHDGLMDEVAVWGRAISSTEIAEIYNSGTGLFYDDWDVAATRRVFNIS